MTNDTRFSELKARAERVIREYRDHDELVVQGAADGMLVSLRSDLALALDDLETALGLEPDAAEVPVTSSLVAEVLFGRPPAGKSAPRCDFRSERTSADFNSPPVRETYERFLSLLVMAGMKDRLDAMEVRRMHGVEKAVEFLGECTLSGEHLEVESVAETATEHALRAIDRADRLLEVCRTSVEALDSEHSSAVAMTMGSELWLTLDEARKALRGERS